MNTSSSLSFGRYVIALVGLLSALTASAAVPSAKTDADLLVKINLPTWSGGEVPAKLDAAFILEQRETAASYDVRLRQALLSRMQAVFKRSGFKGNIAAIENAAESARGCPILVIDLERWQVRNGEDFQMSFQARMVRPDKTVNLDVETYAERFIDQTHSAIRHNGVEKATDGAIAQLYTKVVATGMLH